MVTDLEIADYLFIFILYMKNLGDNKKSEVIYHL